jgi:hypothetical protein
MAARVGLAPTPNGVTDRRATLTLPGNGELALPAGFSPASFRLEGGCLICSTTAAFGNGQRGRTCTCGHSVPGRACCFYTTRCWPRRTDNTGAAKAGHTPWRRSCGKLFKMALPVGLAPTLFPQTTGRFSIQLREQKLLPSSFILHPSSLESGGRCW